LGEAARKELPSTLTDSLKMVLFLTVPTSALIAFLAVPVTRAIYERGRFTTFTPAAKVSVFRVIKSNFDSVL